MRVLFTLVVLSTIASAAPVTLSHESLGDDARVIRKREAAAAGLGSFLKKAVSGIAKVASSILPSSWGGAVNAVAGAVTGSGPVVARIGNAASGLAGSGILPQGMGNIVNTVGNVATQIGSGTGPTLTRVLGAVPSVTSLLPPGIGGVVGGIAGAIGNATSGGGGLGSIVGNLANTFLGGGSGGSGGSGGGLGSMIGGLLGGGGSGGSGGSGGGLGNVIGGLLGGGRGNSSGGSGGGLGNVIGGLLGGGNGGSGGGLGNVLGGVLGGGNGGSGGGLGNVIGGILGGGGRAPVSPPVAPPVPPPPVGRPIGGTRPVAPIGGRPIAPVNAPRSPPVAAPVAAPVMAVAAPMPSPNRAIWLGNAFTPAQRGANTITAVAGSTGNAASGWTALGRFGSVLVKADGSWEYDVDENNQLVQSYGKRVGALYEVFQVTVNGPAAIMSTTMNGMTTGGNEVRIHIWDHYK